MADIKRYNQSILLFGDLEIVCGSFSTSFKRDSEDLTATNSATPYDTLDGKESLEAEAKDVDPALRKTVKKLWQQKVRDTLATYDYDEDTGDLIEDDVFYDAKITELSKEDGYKPFSIKFGIRSYKKQ